MGIKMVVGVVLIWAMVGVDASAAERRMMRVGTTGAFLCTSGYQVVWTPNPAQREIRVRAATLWMGMDLNGVGDFSAQLYTYTREENVLHLLHFTGWDHYANPTSEGSFRKSLDGDWVTVPANGWFYIGAQCWTKAGVHGHVEAFVEYVFPDGN